MQVVRSKILQQGDSNTNYLSDILPKLLRAPLVVGSFLLRWQTITIFFEINIFPITYQQRLRKTLLLEIL